MKNEKKKTTLLKSILLYILAIRIYWHHKKLNKYAALTIKHRQKYDLLQLTYQAGFYSYKKFFSRIKEIKENVDVKKDARWKPTLTSDEMVSRVSNNMLINDLEEMKENTKDDSVSLDEIMLKLNEKEL